MKKQIAIAPFVIAAAIPAVCYANSAVPGPLMYLGAFNTGLGYKWLLLSMFACIVIEGIIYRLTHLFRRPFLVSAILNGISLVAGIPCALIGAGVADAFSLEDFFIVATVLTILLEAGVAVFPGKLQQTCGLNAGKRKICLIVAGANIVSNIALFFLFLWMFNIYPPRYHSIQQCRTNVSALHRAEWEYVEAKGLTNGAAIAIADLAPYLPNKCIPKCPLGGVYCIESMGSPITCSHGPRREQQRGDR